MLLDDWFLDIGFSFRVAIREIYTILPMNVNTVKELYLKYRDEDKLYRATRGRRAKSLILLNNGWCFTSYLSPDELNERIWESRRVEKAQRYAKE